MSRPMRPLLLSPIVIALDVLLINAGFLLSFLLWWNHLLARRQNISAYLELVVVISLATVVTFHFMDLYRDWLRRSLRHVIYSIIIAVGMTLLTTMALGFWSRHFAFPRSVLLTAGILQIGLISAYRVQMRRLYRRWFGNRKTVVIADSEPCAWNIARKFEEHSHGLYSIEGYVLGRNLEPPYPELQDPETVVLAEGLEGKEEIILYCFRQHKEVLVVPNLSELTLFGAEAREIDDVLIFGIQPHRLNPAEELLKRSFDLIASSAALLITSPILLLVSLLVRLTSKGPVLFHQERIGKGGDLFRVLKFRTMVSDAERHSGPVLALERDPRITRFGRFLRATRIDELPQLFNVIKGDMSLVGPRPERAYFVEQFEKELPAYELRHAVKPGLTGLAQVIGRYSTTVESKLRFDLLYIYNYSLLLDVKILLQTVRVVLQREQAAGLEMVKSPADKRTRKTAIDRIRHIDGIVEQTNSQAD
jgi:exopolysaccharide biosynthesis polyprenyl glycosylphosphotransferase